MDEGVTEKVDYLTTATQYTKIERKKQQPEAQEKGIQ